MTDVSPSNRRFIEVVPDRAARTRTEGAAVARAQAAMQNIDIGPLNDLLGTWTGAETGWNMIALPFEKAPEPNDGFNYRVLMNQYSEELTFSFVDEDVPNRGLQRPEHPKEDQEVSTVDYQQVIRQVAVDDMPFSTVKGGPGDGIHHEPGLWLYMTNLQREDDLGKITIARLASIPHGNSVLALGSHKEVKGMPLIPPINAMPSGRHEHLRSPGYNFNSPDPLEDDPTKPDPYLAPYRHYIENPFMGKGPHESGFPGFSPDDMNAILNFSNQGLDILETTILTVDTERADGGVLNAPFVTREAEPVSMRSTFYIQKVRDDCRDEGFRLRMQYSQVVMLKFFANRQDQMPGRALWPHVSIATLDKALAVVKPYEPPYPEEG